MHFSERALLSGIFHIHRRNMSLTLTLTLTLRAHHTSSTYLTPPTVPHVFVKDIPAVYVKEFYHCFVHCLWGLSKVIQIQAKF